jgi:hypothetical protein
MLYAKNEARANQFGLGSKVLSFATSKLARMGDISRIPD